MEIWISDEIKKKLLEKHNVRSNEVVECFENRLGKYVEDEREENKTDPPTVWFIAKTRKGRLLKVVFVYYSKNDYVIKTAFEPNQAAIVLYEKYKNKNA